MAAFYLREIATDVHYQLNGTKIPGWCSEYADQNTQTVTLAANNGEPIVNELIYSSVSGLKVDEDGKALAGATIGLFAASETEFSTRTALMTAVSGENGAFRFDNVPVGNWVVRRSGSRKGSSSVRSCSR